MTNSYLYRHAITGIESVISESFARVLGDNLVKVVAEEKRSPRRKAKSSPVEETAETNAVADEISEPVDLADITNESSKEGNK